METVKVLVDDRTYVLTNTGEGSVTYEDVIATLTAGPLQRTGKEDNWTWELIQF